MKSINDYVLSVLFAICLFPVTSYAQKAALILSAHLRQRA